jgi:hypothetical protein
MRNLAIVAFIVFVFSALIAVAGDMREIELKDGSVIVGEVSSFASGVYTIKTDNLGTVRIEDTKIKSIHTRATGTTGSVPAKNAASPAGAAINTDAITKNPEVMNLIKGLQDDPEVMKVLEDPEIVEAIKNNDVAALMSKPEFLKLLENPAIKNIQKKVQ